MARLGLKKWENSSGKVRKKVCPVGCLSQPTEQNFIYLPIAKFVWKMKKKSGIMKSGLKAMHLFLLDDLLKENEP